MEEPKRRLDLLWLWPVPIGVAIGAIALAPLARSPGDPEGHIIGAGVGGFIFLIVALAWRVWRSIR